MSKESLKGQIKGQVHRWRLSVLTCVDRHNKNSTFRHLGLLHVTERRSPARIAVTLTLMVTNLSEITVTVIFVMALQRSEVS